jgi:hypothetical protein
MSGPDSSATIHFPIRFIDDEIRKMLEDQYDLTFDVEHGEPHSPYYQYEVDITDGIFNFHDSERDDGEFTELEELLVKKNIPFDRETGMEWSIDPHARIYRPGMEKPLYIPQNSDGEAVVKVAKIRRLLRIYPGKGCHDAIEHFLDLEFPSYPPLSDWALQDPV